MKNLKNFINESQNINEGKVKGIKTIDKYPVQYEFQPGLMDLGTGSVTFGVILTKPFKYQQYVKDAISIERRIQDMGFQMDDSLGGYMDSIAGVYNDDWDEMEKLDYVVFVPANSKIATYATFGPGKGEISIPVSM